MMPQDVIRDVWDRLEVSDRMALDFALPDSEKMATDTDRRLAMLAYADRHGKLKDPAKGVLDFLQRNSGHPTAERLLQKHANVTLKICRLEQAMASGVYGPLTDYPSKAECGPFDVWYGLCTTLGSLSPARFDAFMAQRDIASTVLEGPHGDRYSAILTSCDPVLLEHILFENIFSEGDRYGRNNIRYLKPETVHIFMERGLGPERWARYLEFALSAGALDVAELVMAEGYRLDGTRVPVHREEAGPQKMPELRIRTQPLRIRTQPLTKSEHCFAAMYVVAVIAALVCVVVLLEA